MGCDIHIPKERPPYCTPKCTEFKLIVTGPLTTGIIGAQCKRCGLHHPVDVIEGVLLIGGEKTAPL